MKSTKDVILNSAGISVSLVVAEQTVFLSGFTKHEQAEATPALVRGSLVLRVTKPAKIRAINLEFKGLSRTEWPEGIPGEKHETYEQRTVFSHEWRLFNSHFKSAETSSGAHIVTQLDKHEVDLSSGLTTSVTNSLNPIVSNTHSSQALVNQHDAVSKGYRVFNPAEYVYNFELMLPQKLPETVKCNFGNVRWGFHLSIERAGAFKPNLTGYKEITLLRALGPSNLEASEPIVINRNWEDLLHYEIVIAGKAFVIGQSFNVAFALVPMAKVKCHRIRVYITEHTEYFCRHHRIHRVEPSHKFLLLEKKSPDGHRGDLLTTVERGVSGLTEFEFQVEVPEHFSTRRDYLRPNANTENIKVYHWIKAVMRLSREDVKRNGEPKCYEVSIDSPVTLLDRRTLQKNDLPDYSTAKRRPEISDELRPYQEFIQTGSPEPESQRRDSPERAIHFTRQPSIAPPPFDADVTPPTDDTLPPQYDDASATSYEVRYQEYMKEKVEHSSAKQAAEVKKEGIEEDAGEDTEEAPKENGEEASKENGEEAPKENAVEAGPSGTQPLPPPPRHWFERSHEMPVFSEVIWQEEETPTDLLGGLSDAEIDPHSAGSKPSTPILSPTTSPAVPVPHSPASPILGQPRLRGAKSAGSSQRPSSAGRRSSLNPTSAFSPSTATSHMKMLRATSGSSSGHPSPMRRASQSRLSLKSSNPLSMSAGAPLASPFDSTSELPAPLTTISPTGKSTAPNSLWNPAFMASPSNPASRRGSAASTTSGPRFFRQSSMVSVDISRQGGMGVEKRRPSHVGQVEEVHDGYPLSRTTSETSFAISVAEYERLPNERAQDAPLLGNDSEMDLGLEWEHDYEDIDMESDRGSIVSAFYTVLTP